MEKVGGGQEKPKSSCDMVNPRITQCEGREQFRQQADRMAFPPPPTR